MKDPGSKSGRILSLLFMLICIPNILQAQQISEVDLPEDLQRVLTDYETAWQNRNAKALALLFDEEGFILRPGHPLVMGRSNIEAAYRGSGGPLHLRAYDYEISGDIAFIIGGYSASEDTPDSGKYTLTLVRGNDGKWLIRSDMDNGN